MLATDLHGLITVEKLAVEIVCAPAVVEKRREQNDHKHAFVDPQVCVGPHETQIESCGHRHRPLSRFFLEVCERCCSCDGPMNRSVFPNADNADADIVAVTRNCAF